MMLGSTSSDPNTMTPPPTRSGMPPGALEYHQMSGKSPSMWSATRWRLSARLSMRPMRFTARKPASASQSTGPPTGVWMTTAAPSAIQARGK